MNWFWRYTGRPEGIGRGPEKEMEKVVELKVPLVVEVQVAENWKDQEDYTEN